jgi:hypothetical protein
MKDIQIRLCAREAKESKLGISGAWLCLTDQGHGVAGQKCYHATEHNAPLYCILSAKTRPTSQVRQIPGRNAHVSGLPTDKVRLSFQWHAAQESGMRIWS